MATFHGRLSRGCVAKCGWGSGCGCGLISIDDVYVGLPRSRRGLSIDCICTVIEKVGPSVPPLHLSFCIFEAFRLALPCIRQYTY